MEKSITSITRLMYNTTVNAMMCIPDDDFMCVAEGSNVYVIDIDDVEERAEKETDIMQCLTGAESVGRMELKELSDICGQINLQVFGVGTDMTRELTELGMDATSVENLKSLKPGDFILMGEVLEVVVPELEPSLEVDPFPCIMKDDEIYFVEDMGVVFEKIPEKCFMRIGSVDDFKKILALGRSRYLPWAVENFCPEWMPRHLCCRTPLDSFIDDLDNDTTSECIIVSGDNVYTYYGVDWEF